MKATIEDDRTRHLAEVTKLVRTKIAAAQSVAGCLGIQRAGQCRCSAST